MYFFKKFQSMMFFKFFFNFWSKCLCFWNFVGGINLIASRSVVLRMNFFAFLQPMRQQPLKMYQILNKNNDVTFPTTVNKK